MQCSANEFVHMAGARSWLLFCGHKEEGLYAMIGLLSVIAW